MIARQPSEFDSTAFAADYNAMVNTMKRKACQLRGGMDQRLLITLIALIAFVTVAVFVGVNYFSDPHDTGDQQDPSTAEAQFASDKEALVPALNRSSFNETDDPSQDGWDTEVFANKAKKQLHSLGKLFTHQGDIDADAPALETLVTKDFACEPLLPGNLITVLDRPH